MLRFYLIKYPVDIIGWLNMYERVSVFFYSRESMEVLYEMFSCFHHSFSSFWYPEEISMFSHHIKDLSECWLIIIWKKTPRITKTCPSNHESIEILESFWMFYFFHPIVISFNIPIAYHRYIDMLLEIIYTSKICFSSKCLFIGSSMHWDETCSCILESPYEFSEKGRIFPSKSGFYGDWDLYGISHLFYNLECCISIDHEWWSMATFYNFLGWTSHIDIYTGDSISFYDFCSFSKHHRVFSEYLNNERIFIWIVCKGSFLEFFWVNESISWVKFWKYHRLRCYFFHYLPIWTICIAIHGCKSWYGSTRCKVRPERIHIPFIFKNTQKSNFFLSEIYKALSSILFSRFFPESMVRLSLIYPEIVLD